MFNLATTQNIAELAIDVRRDLDNADMKVRNLEKEIADVQEAVSRIDSDLKEAGVRHNPEIDKGPFLSLLFGRDNSVDIRDLNKKVNALFSHFGLTMETTKATTKLVKVKKSKKQDEN